MYRYLFISAVTSPMECLAANSADARAYFFDYLGLSAMPAFPFALIRIAGRV